jgi:hypothetical protein
MRYKNYNSKPLRKPSLFKKNPKIKKKHKILKEKKNEVKIFHVHQNIQIPIQYNLTYIPHQKIEF